MNRPYRTCCSLWRPLALLCSIPLAACTTQQLYGTGQAWQKQECNRIVDAQERGRCLASTNTSYEEYRRQSEAVKAQP